jgi:hypothetical protein
MVAELLSVQFALTFTGAQDDQIDLRVNVDRARRHLASHANVGRSLPAALPGRDPQLLADTQSPRWLRA